MTRAVVLRESGRPPEIEEIELAPTGERQVRVRIVATGVCHSDLSLARGTLPYPVPCVLGHEGAGIVTDVGGSVAGLQPGDHVIVACLQPCHACYFCNHGQAHLCERAMADVLAEPYAELDGDVVHPMQGAGTFVEETLVLDRSVVKIDPDFPLETAALIGCAISTGAGAVLNTADVAPGSSVAVIGCGGVGLSAIQGARMAGATTIIAIDVSTEKLALAERLGATQTINASAVDPAERVRELTDWRGVDYAFEAVGKGTAIRQAYDLTRRGGAAVVVGAGRADDEVSFNALELMFGAKALIGCMGGSTDPIRDFPRYVTAAREGRLDLDGLVTHRVTGLEQVEPAFERMERGEGARTLIVLDGHH